MQRRVIDIPGAPPVIGYAPALEIAGATRMLFLSGQVPVSADGTVPDGIDAQTRQVWSNIFALLAQSDMTADNLVKVTVFLSDGALRTAVDTVSDDLMDGRLVAWTTIIAGIIQDGWLLEIEAVAVA